MSKAGRWWAKPGIELTVQAADRDGLLEGLFWPNAPEFPVDDVTAYEVDGFTWRLIPPTTVTWMPGLD